MLILLTSLSHSKIDQILYVMSHFGYPKIGHLNSRS